jgi:hypothetical protein
LKRFNLKEEEITIIDKKGTSHYPRDNPDQENNRFYLFFKLFQKEVHINFLESIIERNISQICSFYIPSFISNLPNYNLKTLSSDDQELLLLNDKIHDLLEFYKEQFKKFKISIRLCEKLKENLNNQSKATSILVNNLTNSIE